MTGRNPSGTLGAELASRRRRAFVGRKSERELFEAGLDTNGPPLFSVLYVHGPGGIGKSTLLEIVTERALSQDPLPRPQETEPVALSQAAFTDAVRQALHDLQQPEPLARNPLRQTRLVRAPVVDDRPQGDVVADLVREAIESLRAHPRDDKRWRAVDRTYLRPATTQERAAELLGLPFSTYRRHLTEGVARVVAFLWDLEVYGTTSRGQH